MYWCSKLGTERTRLINEFLKDGHVLCDMFCGVGPLSVKAAAKRPKLKVLANDLNPQGVEFLNKNIKLNKVTGRVLPFNMDARKFLRMLVDSDDDSAEKKTIPTDFLRFDHCFMNLPVDAVEFLDCFIGSFNNADKSIWLKEGETEIQLPLIHVYGFTGELKKDAARKYFVDRIGKAMNMESFSE
jgi:tRNA G37 N-methylase Trm5